MSNRPDRPDSAAEPPPDPKKEEGRSGRVRFDKYGQAVWEWAVRTGMFDRNASTARVRALLEPPVKLELAETLEFNKKATAEPPRPPSHNPYERVPSPPSASAAPGSAALRNRPAAPGASPSSKPPARPPAPRKP